MHHASTLGTALMTFVFQRLCHLRNPVSGDGHWKLTLIFLRTQPTKGRERKASVSRQADKRNMGCKVCTEEPPGSCNSPGRSDGQDCLFQGIYEEPALHLDHPTAHSRAAAAAATTASPHLWALLLRHQALTPVHTAEGRCQLFTFIQEAIILFSYPL